MTRKAFRYFAAGDCGGGKGRVFVNNQPATVGVLRQLAPVSRDHSRAERILTSFDAAARLELLDALCRNSARCDRRGISPMEGNPRANSTNSQQGEQDRLRLLDLWTFQKREIEDSKLQPGEDERLEVEKRVLANAEKIYSAAMNAFDLLYEGQRFDVFFVCGRRRSTSKNCRATSRSFAKPWRRLRPPASAWRMWARPYAITPGAFKRRPNACLKLRTAWRSWIA